MQREAVDEGFFFLLLLLLLLLRLRRVFFYSLVLLLLCHVCDLTGPAALARVQHDLGVCASSIPFPSLWPLDDVAYTRP